MPSPRRVRDEDREREPEESPRQPPEPAEPPSPDEPGEPQPAVPGEEPPEPVPAIAAALQDAQAADGCLATEQITRPGNENVQAARARLSKLMIKLQSLAREG
jgi:hypothetical protein